MKANFRPDRLLVGSQMREPSAFAPPYQVPLALIPVYR